MSEPDVVIRTKGLYRTFPRKGGAAATATHYCAGCGHGVAHKLIGEAIADLGLQDRAVMISPVGCAVFGYYYFDCGNVQAAHGRAAAVGTGIGRAAQDAVVISYQGDGDLCSIGLAETLHAANRGERIAIFFVNNAVYGMTGGQMAPTSLIGQKTTTSPEGRSAADTGYPIHAAELIAQFRAPVYVERCSLADVKRIRRARQAIRKALEIQRDRKGFTFVELLSPCPTNMHASPVDAATFVTEALEKEFPLGCLREFDAAGSVAAGRRSPRFDKAALDAVFLEQGGVSAEPVVDPQFATRQVRIAGFGGQGVLSLGLMLARAAQLCQRHVTWFPSYGPEQRGGTCNCSVVLGGNTIGSPVFSSPDVLVALNRPSVERFGPTVLPGGVILFDAMIGDYTPPAGVRGIAVPARDIAAAAGAARAANTAMFGALAALGLSGLPAESFAAAVAETLADKPKLIPVNQSILVAARDWAAQR